MKKILLLVILLVLVSVYAFAGKIPSPPPMEENPALQHYLFAIYNNFNRLEVVSTSPNTTRNGKKGDMLLYISGSTYRLYINVDGSQSWKYATLS